MDAEYYRRKALEVVDLDGEMGLLMDSSNEERLAAAHLYLDYICDGEAFDSREMKEYDRRTYALRKFCPETVVGNHMDFARARIAAADLYYGFITGTEGKYGSNR